MYASSHSVNKSAYTRGECGKSYIPYLSKRKRAECCARLAISKQVADRLSVTKSSRSSSECSFIDKIKNFFKSV